MKVSVLQRSLDFYCGVLGFELMQRMGNSAAFISAGGYHHHIGLNTWESAGGEAPPIGTTGLYHLAILYPSRAELADALRRVIEAGIPLDGTADHGVSEALYLSDPDGNGVELHADRPRSQWNWRNGQVAMTTEPLDFDSLLASTEGQPAPSSVPPQTDLGHIHLHVADLSAAERFYHEFLGLAVTQRSYPGALFLSAGDYHHHLAVNTWAGGQSPPGNSIGLISYRLEVPEAEILYCLRHRAPLAGYEATTQLGETASELLQIRDPNGHWLEVQHVSSPRLTPIDRKRSQSLTRLTRN